MPRHLCRHPKLPSPLVLIPVASRQCGWSCRALDDKGRGLEPSEQVRPAHPPFACSLPQRRDKTTRSGVFVLLRRRWRLARPRNKAATLIPSLSDKAPNRGHNLRGAEASGRGHGSGADKRLRFCRQRHRRRLAAVLL